MTMKNELTLKHGVFITVAVLLIAGIAFAGAGAATTYVDWSEANITSAGGDFIVKVPGGILMPLHTSYSGSTCFRIMENLTLDFNYQPLTFGTQTSSLDYGALFTRIKTTGKILTVKNLVIDGGSISGSMTGGLIGFLYNMEDKCGGCVLENITIKNASISANNNFIGALIGGQNNVVTKIVNCTVDNCSISSTGPHAGGFIGFSAGFDVNVIIDSCVCNSYVVSQDVSSFGGGCGGIIGLMKRYKTPVGGSLMMSNTSVINCIIKNANYNAYVGGLVGEVNIGSSSNLVDSTDPYIESLCAVIGGSLYNSQKIVDCDVVNSVIFAGKSSGGIYGYSAAGTATLTATDNNISFSTIVSQTGSGVAGGFVGKLVPATIASISNNSITNCCVLATSGNAAGFIASGA